MSVNTKVMEALSDLGIPVRFQHYSGEEKPYITFFNYLESGELFADDEEQLTGVYTQLDLWSEGDYADLVSQIHQRMRSAGFLRRSFSDLYETNTNLHHKVMRYYKEVG